MKKRTKVALFAAAAAGVAVAGAKLAQAVQQKNEELNDLIANPVPPAEEEDTSDYVMPGEEAEATGTRCPCRRRGSGGRGRRGDPIGAIRDSLVSVQPKRKRLSTSCGKTLDTAKKGTAAAVPFSFWLNVCFSPVFQIPHPPAGGSPHR